jgi:hypothetical protein
MFGIWSGTLGQLGSLVTFNFNRKERQLALRQSHDLPGGVNVPASHWVIESIAFNRFEKMIGVTLRGWSNAARRGFWKSANARRGTLRAAVVAAQNADPSGPDYSADITAALAAEQANIDDMNNNSSMGGPRVANVVANVNPSGNVILAQVYSSIKALPDWASSNDE